MRAKSFIGACFFILFSFAVVLAQQTVVTGQLVGSDGKPMAKAHVGFKAKDQKNAVSQETTKDGSYKIELKGNGLLTLEYTGVNHQRKSVTLFVEKDGEVKLNVKLSANDYKTDFTELKLVDDTSNFNPSQGKAFKKQADGTYLVEFETEKARVGYEILGLDNNGHTVNGTQSEDYEYDGDGDYKSIVTVKDGKVRIVFDPTKLLRSDSKPEVSFVDASPSVVAFSEIYNGIKTRQENFSKFINDAFKSGKNPQEIFKNYSEKDKADIVKTKIENEKDPFVRRLLILDYFTYITQDKKDENIASQALDEIAPNSPLWSISPILVTTAIAFSKDKEKAEAYFEKFLAENPDSNLKASALLNAVGAANVAQQKEKSEKYLAILQKDYPNSVAAKQAKLMYAEEVVKIGMNVPKFSVVSLNDSQKSYSNESMKGKYYLIDFWATWCKPCVGELPELHKAYDKFKGSNFEILSLSFDLKQEDVTVFRDKKWKMPWLHTFVNNGFESELAKQFGVLGIPKPILVDPNGKVVATEEDLRGENLEKTLTKFLGSN